MYIDGLGRYESQNFSTGWMAPAGLVSILMSEGKAVPMLGGLGQEDEYLEGLGQDSLGQESFTLPDYQTFAPVYSEPSGAPSPTLPWWEQAILTGEKIIQQVISPPPYSTTYPPAGQSPYPPSPTQAQYPRVASGLFPQAPSNWVLPLLLVGGAMLVFKRKKG
jgi:hypothetical protein